MPSPSSPPASDHAHDNPAWFCLRARPKTEHQAARQLAQAADVTVFCPLLRFRRNTRRGRVWFQEALFPGYFFARFVPATHARMVAHSPGVMNIVSFGGGPVPIGDHDIEVLRGLTDSHGVRVIEEPAEIGRQTVVLSGPFRGLEVLVTQVLPAKERVKILLEFLGGLREVEVDLSILEAEKPLPKDIRR